MKMTIEEASNLRALLKNRSALQQMKSEDISRILDSIKKDYEERFCSDLDSIPNDVLGYVIINLPRRTRHDVLLNLDTERFLAAFEHLDDEHISLIMRDLEGVDEGKFKNIFEQLKNIEIHQTEPEIKFEQDFYKKELSEETIIRFYYYNDENIKIEEVDAVSDTIDTKNLVWIDMIKPTLEEIESIERILGVSIPTLNEREEIEVSSRYWEEEGVTTINSYFVTSENDVFVSETVSLLLKDNYLISVRFRKLKSFDELMKKAVLMPKSFTSGTAILNLLLDIRIDIDADMLEKIVKEISIIRKRVISDNNFSEETLRQISRCEDINMKMRESLLDKSRIINSLLKNKSFSQEETNDLRIMIKDVSSLIDHAEFNFERLDSTQNIALAQIGIKQSRSMTTFTIANVLFLPPTLIASMYGMNFEFMPELKWELGYPMSIILMLASSVAPYYYFKKKGWL